MSIYSQVTKSTEFVDRFALKPRGEGVDVIIPLLHATPFWKQNLHSYYREIPIRRLIIGDAGAIDGSPEIAATFPRAQILDHKKVRSLGRSIALLMSEVKTDHFIYLQSDVFLPPGWFDVMSANQNKFDWFGCPESPLIVLSAPINDQSGNRPLAGSQFGRTSVFQGVADYVQDDYGYRQEDFIFEEFALKQGGSVGGVFETFNVHQITERVTTGKQLKVSSVSVTLDLEDDDSRVLDTQLLGFVKYCDPRRETVYQSAYRALIASLAAGRFSIKRELFLARQLNGGWTKVLLSMYIRACIFALPTMFVKKTALQTRTAAKRIIGYR